VAGRSLRRHAARGTVITGIFTIAVTTLGLLRGFIVAAFLHPRDYGVWGILLVAIGGLFWFKQVGISDKYVQQDEPDQELAFQKAFTLEALFTGCFTLAVTGAIPLIALAYGRWQIVAPGLVLCLYVIAMIFQSPIWIHYREMDYLRQRSLLAIEPIVGFVVTVALAIAGLGYWSMVIGTVAGGWAAAAGAVYASPYPLRWRYDRGTLREYAGFSWPIFYTNGSRFVLVQATILVGNWTLGLVALGYMSLSATVSQYANRLDDILAQTLYPAICAVKDRTDLLFESFVKSNRLALLWGIPFGVGIALFAGDLVHFAIGRHWAPAVPIISVFGLIAAINHLAYNWDDYFRALGDTKPIAVWGWANLATTLAVTLPLLIAFGIDGFAVGMVVNTLVSLAVRVHFLTRLFPGFAMLRHAARAIAPTIPAADAVLIMRLLSMHHHRTAAMAAVEIVSFVVITCVATAALERSLVREVMGYLRPAAVPQVSGAA
jgi:O-antigen/teichoic acid export membrane protein